MRSEKNETFTSSVGKTYSEASTTNQMVGKEKENLFVTVIGILLSPLYFALSIIGTILRFSLIVIIVGVLILFLLQKITGIPIFMLIKMCVGSLF